MAKEYLAKKNIPYKEKDVASDIKAREDMVKKSGQLGVPVIDVGGHIIVGFDREKLNELIGIK